MDKIEEAKILLLKTIADYWYVGCMAPEFDEVKAELRAWKKLGQLAHMLIYPQEKGK